MGTQLFATAHRNERLLTCLVELYPQYTKDRLFSFILCGQVKVNEETIKDHLRDIKKDCTIILYDDELVDADGTDSEGNSNVSTRNNFVSRGGKKLQPALEILDVDVHQKVWLDSGCATGGFTQCLLQYGASVVHAVDVSYNTLDYLLRIDSRVILHERTNILAVKNLDPSPQKAVADLSFRSLRGVAKHILELCEENYLLALCKPQFEYAYEIRSDKREKKKTLKKYEAHKIATKNENHTKFDGVLTDPRILKGVLYNLFTDLLDEGVAITKIVPAGIPGREGNQEYFLEMHTIQIADENQKEKEKILNIFHTQMTIQALKNYYQDLISSFVTGDSSK